MWRHQLRARSTTWALLCTSKDSLLKPTFKAPAWVGELSREGVRKPQGTVPGLSRDRLQPNSGT